MTKHIRKRRAFAQRLCPICLTPSRKGVADRLFVRQRLKAVYHIKIESASRAGAPRGVPGFFSEISCYPMQNPADFV